MLYNSSTVKSCWGFFGWTGDKRGNVLGKYFVDKKGIQNTVKRDMSAKSLLNDIVYMELQNSEEEHYNTNYWVCQDILNCIISGKPDLVLKYLSDVFVESFINHGGSVSNDPDKRIEYLLVIIIHRMGKAAVDGGLFPNEGNRIADHYLRRLSETSNPYKALGLIKEAAYACASAVAAKKKNMLVNSYVEEAKDYILTHLTTKIRLSDMAENLRVSPCHLSRIFHKATGTTLFSYILKQKLEASTILLLHTEKPISEICALFQFSNQSYYTMKFSEEYGITPKQYALKNRRLEVSSHDQNQTAG